ncbi:MAG: formate--tetrahydrofolate ligase [Bacteroidales bacterium]|nr:formate--tetrahydrofolate ligase [Bacteroidales bacterium]
MKSDIEIAQATKMKHISEVAEQMGIEIKDLELYGNYKAKLPLNLIDEDKVKKSKLVLVTALTPTPAGEGKTTTSIGLAQAMNIINKKTTVVLREPSLGPVFGIKGGAAGGGHAQVVPMEDINLHFTGDLSAVEKAHNLLAALIDNNLQQKSVSLDIDPRTIEWKRVMDMNERALRSIVIGLGGKTQGVPRESGFYITAASEVMAILCMATDMEDLKRRLGNIFVGYTYGGQAVYARDLNAQGAMAVLLKDAIKPNLVQTLEGTPAIVHGGPFANIAQGTNTILGTKMGMSLSDYVVTEAGFASELGAEKFFDIKCRMGGLTPDAVVIVATIRALKYHGGADAKELNNEDVSALKGGLENLEKHIENMQEFGLKPIVAINKFVSDTDKEIDAVADFCKSKNVEVALNDSWAEGGEGAVELAEKVVKAVDDPDRNFKPLYELSASYEEKIETIATKIYGADGVEFSAKAKKQLRAIEKLELDDMPVCIAKTQKSLSDDASLRGRPKNYKISVREVELSSGAGFIVPIAGAIMRMPGLPSKPSAENIDIDINGNITGLF